MPVIIKKSLMLMYENLPIPNSLSFWIHCCGWYTLLYIKEETQNTIFTKYHFSFYWIILMLTVNSAWNMWIFFVCVYCSLSLVTTHLDFVLTNTNFLHLFSVGNNVWTHDLTQIEFTKNSIFYQNYISQTAEMTQ